MKKVLNLLKMTMHLLIKFFYIMSFIVVCILLLKMLYFPELALFYNMPEKHDIYTEYTRNRSMINRIIKQKEPVSREHFHITDKQVQRLENEPPFCMTCHGIYPHVKDIKSISYLNLHVGFMACEVCHVRRSATDTSMSFRWVEDDTGKISVQTEGKYGKYTAKIITVRYIDGEEQRIDIVTEEKFAEMYMDLKDGGYPPWFQENEAMNIHKRNLSKKAVTCLECHIKKGYLPLKKLGFPQYRINQISSSEVSRMLGQYESFYVPRMLKP